MNTAALVAAIAPGGAAPKLEESILAIKSYKFGDSTAPLRGVEGVVNGSLGDAETRMRVALSLSALVASSDATRDARIFACRQLAVCGSAGNIVALAPMLVSIDTSDMARIALERIPGAEADAALIDALGKADDKSKIGIVNSLGVRKAASAVPAIAPLLKSKDPLLAESAAAALGHIGGADAVKALKGRMNKAARATAESVLKEQKK